MTKDQAWKLRDLIPDSEIYPRVESGFHTKRLAITSGKGGVGKSVIALNLSLLLARYDYKTLIIDGDVNLSKLPIMVNYSPKFSFIDVKRGDKQINEFIFEFLQNCSILPTGSGAIELINRRDDFHRQFVRQFQQLDGQFDYMVIDTASGISSTVFGQLASSDEVLVVATPEPTAIADAFAVIKILSFYYPYIPVHIVFNFVESEDEAFDTYKKFELIVQKFLHRQINYLGFLFNDEHVLQSIKKQDPLARWDVQTPFMDQLEKIMNRWLELLQTNYGSISESQN